jgi:hypothetical protein
MLLITLRLFTRQSEAGVAKLAETYVVEVDASTRAFSVKPSQLSFASSVNMIGARVWPFHADKPTQILC